MASQVRNGKAFEWAVGIELVNNFGFKLHDDEIAKHNKACFDDSGISDKQRNNYQQSAKHAVEHIVEKENLEEDSGIISFLPDKKVKKVMLEIL
jgi:hypothetical protein